MNNNVTDLLNEQEIKTDIMRYKNNGTSFWLSILAIIGPHRPASVPFER